MDSYRELFPVTSKKVYLNHAANSPEPLPVLAAVQEYLTACSNSGTAMEAEWRNKPTQIREGFAQLFSCSPSNIAFLPNVSAAVNLVAGGLAWQPGDNVVVARDQFPANIYPWIFLQSSGVEVRFADWYSQGLTDSIRKLADNNTKVIAVSWVEYFSGHRHALADIGSFCREEDICFVVDAIQGVGVVPLRVNDIGADVVAIGGHKWLLGPEGQGASFFSSRILDKLNPVAYSWRSVQDFMNFDQPAPVVVRGADRFEAGTPNWPGIFGLGAAVKLVLDIGPEYIFDKVFQITNRLMEGLEKLPGQILTPYDRSMRAGIVSFLPQERNADGLVEYLLEKDIVCSARRGALRISPHFYNTLEEIELLIAALEEYYSPRNHFMMGG